MSVRYLSMKSKKPTIIKYKRALSSAKAISKDKLLSSAKAEKFIKDVKPFLTKEGKLKKNLSYKKQAEFNQIVAQYKGSAGALTKKGLKASTDKRLESAIANKTVSSKASHDELIKTFKTKTVQSAMKKGIISSDQIVSMKKTFKKVTATDIVKVAKVAKKELEATTPAEAMDDMKRAEYTGLIEEILARDHEYRDEDIPF